MGRISTLTPMEGFWPIFFLMVVLKIPVFGALGLIWWAGQAPEPEGAEKDVDDHGPERWRPYPRPRGPQHGPSSGAMRRGRGAPPGQRRPGFRTDHSAREPTRPAKTPATGRGTPSSPPHTR